MFVLSDEYETQVQLNKINMELYDMKWIMKKAKILLKIIQKHYSFYQQLFLNKE